MIFKNCLCLATKATNILSNEVIKLCLSQTRSPSMLHPIKSFLTFFSFCLACRTSQDLKMIMLNRNRSSQCRDKRAREHPSWNTDVSIHIFPEHLLFISRDIKRGKTSEQSPYLASRYVFYKNENVTKWRSNGAGIRYWIRTGEYLKAAIFRPQTRVARISRAEPFYVDGTLRSKRLKNIWFLWIFLQYSYRHLEHASRPET